MFQSLFEQGEIPVLSLAGTELIFFIEASIVLRFGFVSKTVLTTHQFSATAEQCLHSVKVISVSHAAAPARRLGVHRGLGGDTARTADPN